MDSIAPDMPQIVKLLVAMTIVIGLMGGLAFIMKKLGLSTPPALKTGKKHRLQIVESLPLDLKRRLVIVRRDDTEHLIVLGATSETVIEQNITPPILPVDSSDNSPSSP